MPEEGRNVDLTICFFEGKEEEVGGRIDLNCKLGFS